MNFLMIIIFLFIQLPSKSNAEGDLSIRSKKLVALLMFAFVKEIYLYIFFSIADLVKT